MSRRKKGGRGTALRYLRGKGGWLPTLQHDLVFRVLQEEIVEEHKHFLQRYLQTGVLPDDWDRDFQDVHPTVKLAKGRAQAA